jgi:hypothetical protein
MTNSSRTAGCGQLPVSQATNIDTRKSDNHRWFRTIDDLFTLVETASETADTLRVAYDQTLGYPAYIYIDYDHAMVGEEVELQVISLSATD